MSPRYWKLAAIILVLMTILTVQLIQGFHSVQSDGFTQGHSYPGSGTLIVVESLPNVNTRINITLQYNPGLPTEHADAYLLNGTRYNLSTSNQILHLNSQINGKWIGYQSSGNFGFVELNSTGNPIGVAIVNNFSMAHFNHGYLSSYAEGANYYAVFVSNETNYSVKVVSMPL